MATGVHEQICKPEIEVHESGGSETAELERTDRPTELWVNNVPQELDARGDLPQSNVH